VRVAQRSTALGVRLATLGAHKGVEPLGAYQPALASGAPAGLGCGVHVRAGPWSRSVARGRTHPGMGGGAAPAGVAWSEPFGAACAGGRPARARQRARCGAAACLNVTLDSLAPPADGALCDATAALVSDSLARLPQGGRRVRARRV